MVAHQSGADRQAVRQLANRWAGILHEVLEQGCLYDEDIAWPKS